MSGIVESPDEGDISSPPIENSPQTRSRDASPNPGGLPPLPKLTSPTRKTKTQRKMNHLTAKDFAEQIRQLEEAGKKLTTAAVYSTPDDRYKSDYTARKDIIKDVIPTLHFTDDMGDSLSSRPLRARAASLSSLPVATSATQPQLPKSDFGRMDDLQQQGDTLLTPASLPGMLPIPGRLSLPSQFTSQEPPTKTEAVAPDYLNKWMMEKKLTDSETEVNQLKSRITELKDQAEHQRKCYTSLIEELKMKLQDAVYSRESILELREKEMNGQECLISKLQVTVTQLQESNRNLEEQMSQATLSLNSYQQNQMVLESAIKQMKALLVAMETKRGKAYFDTEPLHQQSPTMLVHTLERCLQDYEVEIDFSRNKMKHMGTELADVTRDYQEFRKTVSKEHQEKLTCLAEEHEKQVTSTAERSMNARKQAANLQEQLDVLQNQNRSQLKLKNEHITDLEEKLAEIRREYDHDKKFWNDKKCGFELSLDESHKELTMLRTDREDLKKEMSLLTDKTKHLENTVERLQNELDVEKDQVHKLQDREEELIDAKRHLEDNIETKGLTIIKLQSSIDALKNESFANLKEQMASMEKTARDRAMEQITVLQDEVMTITHKYNVVNGELDLTKKEMMNLKSEITTLTEKFDITRQELSTISSDKQHVSALLQDRVGDCQRLTSERDYYYNLLDERNIELTSIQEEFKTLKLDVSEKKHDMEALQKKSHDMTSVVEVKSRNEALMKEEHEKLAEMINEKISEIVEIKAGRDNIHRKLKIREKRLKELETGAAKMKDDLKSKTSEFDDIQTEKESLFLELKESRYEVAFLTDEINTLKKVLEGAEGDMQKQVKKLVAKLECTEKDLRLAKKALKRKEGFGGKAMKAAGKMQKEVTVKRSQVDSLQSKIYWLEECIDSLRKEKNAFEEESEKLASLVGTTGGQNDKLSKELEAYIAKYKSLRLENSKLTGQIEKSAINTGNSQSKIEALEQDIARLKLKHQLEIKEFRRTGNLSRNLTPPFPLLPGNHLTEFNLQDTKEQMKPSNLVDEGVGQELKSLLVEMRALVNQSTTLAQIGNNDINERSSPSHKNVQFDYDLPISPQKLEKYIEANVHPTTSPTLKPLEDVLASSLPPSGRLSPVSDLLYSPRDIQPISYNIQSHPLSSHHRHHSSNYPLSSGKRSHSLAVSMASESQQMCRRLEEKMQNLTKVGSNLKIKNREMAAVMKEDDRKLRKCKKGHFILKTKS